jgi:hypothetical protein
MSDCIVLIPEISAFCNFSFTRNPVEMNAAIRVFDTPASYIFSTFSGVQLHSHKFSHFPQRRHKGIQNKRTENYTKNRVRRNGEWRRNNVE